MPEMNKNRHNIKSKAQTYSSEIKRYFLLLLFPLILGVALLVCIHYITSVQIERRGNATASYLSANASNVLREMQLVSDSLLNDGYFLHEITADSVSDPAQLCATIRSHLRNSPYVSKAYVISKTHGHIFTSDSYYLYDSRDALLRQLSLVERGEETPLAINYDPGWHILNANYAPPYYIASIPGFDHEDTFLLVTLNVREFLRSFYATDADLCCVYNDEFSFSTLLKNYPNLNWTSPKEVTRIFGEKVRCFYVESEEFTYLTAISTKEYRAPLRTVIYVFSAYFALVFLMGFIFLIRVSKRRYRSIAAMVDGLPHGLGANPTYDDILSAVRSTLSTYRDKYKEEQERTLSLCLQQILTDGLRKQITAQQFSAAGILPACSGYCVCLIHIAEQDMLVTSGPLTLNIDTTNLILKSAFTRISDEKLEVAVAFIENRYYPVFSLKEDVSNEFIRNVVTSTIDLLEEEYEVKIHSAVSSIIAKPTALHAAFTEVNNLHRFSISVGSRARILFHDDMETGMDTILDGSYLKKFEILSRTLVMEKYDVIPSMVEVILAEHVSEQGPNYTLAGERLAAVANLLAESVAINDIPGKNTQDLAQILRSTGSVSELNIKTKEVFSLLLKNPRHLENDHIINKVCLFIQENLSNQNLSVPEISQYMKISTQHLSRLFRQKMNTTVLEYINTCRIDMAKKTLVETSLTVSQVAEIVGYNNTVTLSRNFKRYVGLPPSEYRVLNK